MKFAIAALVMSVNSIKLERPHEKMLFATGVDIDEVEQMGS